MLEEIIEFCKIIGNLKKNKRTGWITEVGIKNAESVADHIFRTTILTMILSDMRRLDTEKMIRMALLHDLEEAIMGDWDVKTKEEFGQKEVKRREMESIKKILSKLPEKLEKKYMELWKETKEKRSEEAKLIEGIDKLEMVFQTLEYEKDGYDKERLKKFWEFSKKRIEDPELKKIFELLEKERIK